MTDEAENQKMMRDSVECCADEFFLEAVSEGVFSAAPDVNAAADKLDEILQGYCGPEVKIPDEIVEPDEYLAFARRQIVRGILEEACGNLPSRPRAFTHELPEEVDPNQEVRLTKGETVVSIWLPGPAGEIALAMTALSLVGFDFYRVRDEEAGDERAE